MFRVRKRRKVIVGGKHSYVPGLSLGISALVLCYPATSFAGVAVLRPPREALSSAPLEVTILYSGDQPDGSEYNVPAQLKVAVSNIDVIPTPLTLTRDSGTPDHIKLATGDLKAVRYSGTWPKWARGAMKIDIPDLDASPSFVMLTRPPNSGKTTELAQSAGAPGTPGQVSTIAQQPASAFPVSPAPAPARANAPSPEVTSFLSRFSAFEPMYFADGSNGENLAKFQLSFKFRMVIPDDPRSKRFVDNLYFGYTQTSLWDLGVYSAPFRDTSYMPQLFYSLDDTGWKSSLFSKMGLMAGYGHESNGRDGPESRGIDILFVRPTWEFGDLNANHLTVSPKFYYYVHIAGENHDIADYRGYVDLLLKYGSTDGWQLAATLRKGTKSTKGSIDTQFTYPLAKLINSAWGGYLWVGFFTGYGEDILDYNQHRWIARIGYSITR
ncbi:outer membrane phospholipase A [Paraburkholderia sp. RAU2J]|uniref:phospholipase A n=1 Tax=Paraburkholderia sp. RAU2J TaxID=1938810 RepID=UPI000EADFED9|nr:phospholipase A [Paraburkholderia sp. RAU2J]RKT21379.1 outer membrane phospholipase A [Paraburkholderia sp. RAU2J]